MLEALFLLACQIAAEVDAWPPEKQERLEACREFCRSVCTELGRTPQTECLSNLWVLITMTQCRLGGTSGHDIDADGMACRWNGMPACGPWRPISVAEENEPIQAPCLQKRHRDHPGCPPEPEALRPGAVQRSAVPEYRNRQNDF